MHKLRTQLGEGFKRETSERYTRMGNIKVCVVDDLVLIEQDVYIDDAGIPFYAPHATHRRFDGVDAIQQFVRRQWSTDLNDLVQEGELMRVDRRDCTIAWRNGVDNGQFGCGLPQREGQVRGGIAEARSQEEKDQTRPRLPGLPAFFY